MSITTVTRQIVGERQAAAAATLSEKSASGEAELLAKVVAPGASFGQAQADGMFLVSSWSHLSEVKRFLSLLVLTRNFPFKFDLAGIPIIGPTFDLLNALVVDERLTWQGDLPSLHSLTDDETSYLLKQLTGESVAMSAIATFGVRAMKFVDATTLQQFVYEQLKKS